MTPEQEIERIKKDYAQHWPALERNPTVQRALANKDPIKLGEIAALIVHGNYQDGGAASQSRHSVLLFLDYESRPFSSVEDARNYLAHVSKTRPPGKVFLYQNINGHWDIVPA